MASFSCENCGFTGERPATGACPRCGHTVALADGFRVPPLPSPEGAVSTEVEPDRESAPPGGYLDLDLGEAGRADTGAQAGPAPRERRRPVPKTGPSFAAVAPREQPGSPRSVMPIFIGVGVGCVALILVGVLLSRGPGEPTPAPATAAAPAPATEPAPAAPPAAPASEPVPAPEVLAASAVSAEPPPAAPARRAEARTEPRTTRRAEKQAAAAPRTTSRPTAPATQVLPAPPPPAPAPSPTTPVLPAAAAAPSQPAVIEDAPRYAAEGFRRPQLAEPQCVQHSIRAPRDIASRVDGPVTIRFAVGPDGSISLFQIMGDVPDPRLPDMLESAVRSCTFLPGADAQGRPVRMWVTMPIRFAR